MKRGIASTATAIVAVGFVLRLAESARAPLNPDEAHYFDLSLPGRFSTLWATSLRIYHPPLLVFILHAIIGIGSSEVMLRLVPALAGSIFAWVAYLWLSKIWNAGAGLVALLILTFSPNLVSLSSQVRGYTLMLALAAFAMLCLEATLESGSALRMVLFTGSLYLAILSEYSAAWFVGAAALYFLIRGGLSRVSRRVWLVWALGQCGALLLYALLYRTSIDPLLTNAEPLRAGYLSAGFPGAHQSLVVFCISGTLKQFAYALSSTPLGLLGAALYATGLALLWRGRATGEEKKGRALIVLLVSPFLLALCGAILRLHPYGRTRQTVVLSLFIAAGAGIAVERILRSRQKIAILAALALLVSWPFVAAPDSQDIPKSRQRRQSLMAAIAYLRTSVPQGSLVITDRETSYLLRYYLCGTTEYRETVGPDGLRDGYFGSIHAAFFSWDMGSADDFSRNLEIARRRLGFRPDESFWVAEGGFDTGIASRLRTRYPGISLPAFRDFDGTMIVFRTPPGI